MAYLKLSVSRTMDAVPSDFIDIPNVATECFPPSTITGAASSEQTEQTRTIQAQEIKPQESLSLQDKEIEMIKNALEKHRGKRKGAAAELGISERTLYRKIKQYDL